MVGKQVNTFISFIFIDKLYMEVFILCIFLLTQRHVSDFNWVFLTEKKIIFLNEMIDNYTWQYMYQGTDFNMKIYQFFSYTLFVVLANFRKYMRYLKKMNKKKTTWSVDQSFIAMRRDQE